MNPGVFVNLYVAHVFPGEVFSPVIDYDQLLVRVRLRKKAINRHLGQPFDAPIQARYHDGGD
jgi:hypothetical protein